MALTIHAPHLPHLEDWGRHRTLMIGIAAVAAADAAPAAATTLEFGSGHVLPGTGIADSAPSAAAVDTGEFLGLETAPAARAAVGSVTFRSGHLLR